MRKPDITLVLYFLLKNLSINVTKDSITSELSKHPEPNSFLAINNLLNSWQVPNLALKVSFEQLEQLQTPYIAALDEVGFTLITSIGDKGVKFIDEQGKRKNFTIAKFKAHFTGNILCAEKNEESGELNYKTKHFQEKLKQTANWLPLSLILLLVILYALNHERYLSSLTWPVLLIQIITLLGTGICLLLVSHNITENNRLVARLCGQEEDKNCNAVLSSDAAYVGKYLSWGELGLFYFAGCWFAAIFFSQNTMIYSVLAKLSVLALPFIIYSLYYQIVVVGQWCALCCSVLVILGLNAIVGYPFLTLSGMFIKGVDLVNLGACFLVVPMVWFMIKPKLTELSELKILKGELLGFKYNRYFFNQLMGNQPNYKLLTSEDALLLSSISPPSNTITVVSNPYCKPCAEIHNELDQLLAIRPDIQLQIVFLTQPDKSDPKHQVASALMSLYLKGEQTTVSEALHDWFETRDLANWRKKYHKAFDIEFESALEVQRNWCELTNVRATPTLFFNGKKLPESYRPSDLRYLL